MYSCLTAFKIDLLQKYRGMRYEKIKDHGNEKFKRLTGIRKETFSKMLNVLETEIRDFGRPPKLSRADQLLMTLMYLREYRTQFHMDETCGVSEATVSRNIKKVLQDSETVIEVVVVDVAKWPIERPKKNKKAPTAVKRSDIPKKHR